MPQQTINIGTAPNDRTGDTWRDAFEKTNDNFDELYLEVPSKRIVVKDASQMSGTLDSTVEYFIDGDVDFTGVSIVVPAGGLYLRGYNFDISKMCCADVGYTMFTSPAGGSGNVLMVDLAIEVTGSGSQVYSLEGVTGFEAIEVQRINWNDCTSMGTITNYRQGLEAGTGRFGGTPTLTLAGTWVGGYFIDTSIVRSLDAGMTGALFEAGAGFTMASRFRSNQNIDLPASASFFDFAPSNFTNDSTVQLTGCIITRNGVSNPFDTNIAPNMDHEDLESLWRDNNGIQNTHVGGVATVTTQSATTVAAASTFYDVAGTFTASALVHFDSPSTGQLRNLGANPVEFRVVSDLVVQGTANDEITVKLVMWDDSAAGFVDVPNGSQTRPINNLVGGNDVAFFTLFPPLVEMGKNDYLKLQVSNATAARNVTLLDDSFYTVIEL